MKYIAQLLRSPGRTISCSALQGALTPGSKLSKEDEERLSTVTSRDEILDETARREYSEGLAEIEEELEEATKNNDLGRIEALRRNKEMIENQLRAATNIRGQGREFDTPEERARKAVSGGIGRAIRAIAEHHRTLAEHLRRNIELGGFCHYNGDGIDWDV
jgi:hypothetical protein